MRVRTKTIIGVATAALLVPFAVPSIAQAVDLPKPSKSVCSEGVANKDYACMKVNAKKVPSGETATFTGNLSTNAQKQLKSWTKGDNIVCLTRYRTKPKTYGPAQILDEACTTVRKNGEFTINAELGRKGTYYYGLEMGPCRAKAGECGNSDPGLIDGANKANKALQLETT
jgi:hypothetical protein